MRLAVRESIQGTPLQAARVAALYPIGHVGEPSFDRHYDLWRMLRGGHRSLRRYQLVTPSGAKDQGCSSFGPNSFSSSNLAPLWAQRIDRLNL